MTDLITHTRPHHIALENWARDIWDAYLLGNKAEARVMFNQVPEDRRGYVAFHITSYSMSRHQLTKKHLEAFFRSTMK
jgi:hypothetical protein